MGVCMCLKAVTNTQINDFFDDSEALNSFLTRVSDPRAVIAKMLGAAALKDPRFAQVAQVFGLKDGLPSSEVVDDSPFLDLDKVWHGLHWIFTGSAYEGPEPLCYLVHKGLVIGQRRDSQVRAFSSKQLAAFEAALHPFDEAEVRRRFNGPAMVAADINLSAMWGRDPEEGIEALNFYLPKLKLFLSEAKARNEGMLIWVT